LSQAQVDLARGHDGTGKYLSCSPATLRWIAERKPGSLDALMRAPGMGAGHADRFGPAFLKLLQDQ
ncbi:hypothetical protein LCGC14_2889410, partial [marine sediment metagenome]